MTASVQSSAVSTGQVSPRTVDVPLILQSTAPSAAQPVSGGLCLPKGLIQDVASAGIDLDREQRAAQTKVLSRWSDGSIRWLLTSWIAPASDQDLHGTLRLTPANPGETTQDDDEPSLRLQRHGSHFAVQQFQPRQTPPQFTEFAIIPRLVLPDGSVGDIEFGSIEKESEGPIHAVYTADGILAADRSVGVRLRFEIWPSAGLLQIHTRLLNRRRARHRGGLWDLGDSGSFLFSGLHVDVEPAAGADVVIRWKAEAGSELRELGNDDCLKIRQKGSGGPAWACTNHVGADGTSTVSGRGYEAITGNGTVRGHRSEPIVTVESEASSATFAVPEFWQKFPSSLEAGDGTVSIGLFPVTEGMPYELQGGEQSTQSFWLSTSADAGTPHWVTHRARMVQPVEWVRDAAVFDWFAGRVETAAADSGDDAACRYVRWLGEATAGDRSLQARRDSIDEYGWRNFGDVPADHEQTHYAGTNTIISHYNNQFDLIYGGILNMMVSGDGTWQDLFDPLARHVMDIDIYHTNEDRAEFNGGLFWHTDHYVDARTATHRTYSRHNCPEGGDYGGGPSNEHNYATGLVYYYYLTGNPEAVDAVRSLGDWVFGLDDGASTVFALLDDGPSGQASTTVEDGYHGPGRGSGNSISVLLDAWELTKDERYLCKAEELIQRVVHPKQDIDALDLLNAEYRWSYTVCLTSLGRYLAKMDEADRRGPLYDYVRRTLCHFGGWMLEHERPTLSAPDGLEFVTEAWAAQEFRKANVLRIAASCCDDEELAGRMRRRADELNDAAWRDLYAFGDKHLTARCFSIVMTEGLRDVFHRMRRQHHVPKADETAEPGEWTMFIPQRTRVKQMLKSPEQLVAALPRLFRISGWMQTLDALRRRLG